MITAKKALVLIWILFALLAVGLVILPASAQAPMTPREIPVYVDQETGLATLQFSDLLRMQNANAALAAEVQRLREKTGCL